jgi:predicted transcriptional regulator
MKIILSIKPQFAEAIFNGEKQYEFRKVIFTKKIESIIVYSTKPVGKFIGEFEIEEILEETPHKLWNKTQKQGGVSKNFFFAYFNGRKKGYAIKVGPLKRYKQPIDPFDILPKFVAPQSFRYLQDKEIEEIVTFQ